VRFSYGTPDEWIEKLIGPLKKQGITPAQIRKGQVINNDIPTIPYEDKVFMTELKKFEFITGYDFKGTGDSSYPFLYCPRHKKRKIAGYYRKICMISPTL
ncbi:MAG: hypothetical protein ACUZ8H_04815, partial [Candidatus Anammoxibacter sp.]